MKMIFLLSSLISLSAFAARPDCAVDGISDSPQILTCNFENRTILLTCTQGKYVLGIDPVLLTWHEEVEEGNNPLAFKTQSMVLKITKVARSSIYNAILEESGPTAGTCR